MTATFGAPARAVATHKGLIQDLFAEPWVRAVGVQYFARFLDNQIYADDGAGNARMTGVMNILIAHSRFLANSSPTSAGQEFDKW